MTLLPPTPLRLTHREDPDSARFELHGDLDHYWADILLEAVEAVLAGHTGLHEVRLHCAGLTAVDSSGLSALLMIRRRTSAAGVRLYVEERPLRLERLLELTGTLEYLTAPEAGAQGAGPGRQRQRAAEDPIPGRSGTTEGL
ncbi:STAS domain-containing protein [Streptomyces xanthophaeus]|uniref:Sulfate transporter n=1 Tax=Streptomyces xanthophaeus TaxID=67385 RepID=A0A919GUS3_9ACTN|nr:STAS domain-containing protein [Streptomyces xanthophaeus]GHI84931.1 sulfate transporter [Streptomyces xanthophaeus]